MALNADEATAIINEYNSSDDYESIAMPEEVAERIQLAQSLVEEARKLFDQGVRDNMIQGLLWMGEEPTDLQKTLPRKSSGGFPEGDLREANAPILSASDPVDVLPIQVRENLPIPRHIEGDPDPMPRDLSDLSDKEVRRLSGVYNAYLARTTYLLGVETADMINAQHLLENYRNNALRGIVVEKKLAKVIEAEVAADKDVKIWTDNVVKHEGNVTILKALKEIYSGNVDRLSREWTMRQNEWEKSR